MLLGWKALMSPTNTPKKLKSVPAECLLGVSTGRWTVRKVWRTSEPLLTMVTASSLGTPSSLGRFLLPQVVGCVAGDGANGVGALVRYLFLLLMACSRHVVM